MANDHAPLSNEIGAADPAAGSASVCCRVPAAPPRCDSPFLADVLRKLVERPQVEKPVGSLTEAWLLLGVAVLHFEETIHRDDEMCRNELARRALVHVAATACRAARDLGIESRSDAIGKDIPF